MNANRNCRRIILDMKNYSTLNQFCAVLDHTLSIKLRIKAYVNKLLLLLSLHAIV